MPTIKNKTTQLHCLTGKDGETVAIKRDSSMQISQAMWDANKDMAPVKALLASRGLLVINQAEPPTEQVSSSSPPAAAHTLPPDERVPGEDQHPGDWTTIHWRRAQKLIAAETNLASLQKLLDGEERAKIKSMLEERIEELEA